MCPTDTYGAYSYFFFLFFLIIILGDSRVIGIEDTH